MHIGFISTRISGIDGVSLEIHKWGTILNQLGHKLFYCAGELSPDLKGSLIPELHFHHPEITSIQNDVFYNNTAIQRTTNRINRIKDVIYDVIKGFLGEYHIDVIIAENILSIPMNIPLALAMISLIEDLKIPTIAHHHDFIWERERFSSSQMQEMLDQTFPPKSDLITHVVINSIARKELLRRRGIEAVIIPNIFDFTNFYYGLKKENIDFRSVLGLCADDWMVLQPTRIIPRKGIEHAITLVRYLREPANRKQLFNRDVKLVLSHPSGDEGNEYFEKLKQLADYFSVPVIYAAEKMGIGNFGTKSNKIFQLWDAYLNADFVTYPSIIEGYGNAFLEAVYFRLPILIRRYEVFKSDIEPLGFDLIKFDQEITAQTVKDTIEVMVDPIRRRRMVEWNFNLAREYFSYNSVKDKLSNIIERSINLKR